MPALFVFSSELVGGQSRWDNVHTLVVVIRIADNNAEFAMPNLEWNGSSYN